MHILNNKKKFALITKVSLWSAAGVILAADFHLVVLSWLLALVTFYSSELLLFSSVGVDEINLLSHYIQNAFLMKSTWQLFIMHTQMILSD